MFTVYILKSLKDKNLYIGQTNNLKNRLAAHKKGQVRSTKKRAPFKLIYKETYPTRTEAVNREKFFKTHGGYNYLKKFGFY